ncbi:MAG: sigma factor-like helix-turn-helix DNA-binding protein, partial [Actinomycetota bacterium]
LSRHPEQPAQEEFPEVAGGDAEGEAMSKLGTDWARKVIRTLSPDQGDVLMLRIVAGLSLEEVARATGKTTGSVKALQRRGLAAIKKKIDQPVSL